jgi:hypothetical protein
VHQVGHWLRWNSTCFGQFLCPSSGVFHCTHNNVICHTGLLTACEQAVSKLVWHIPLLCVQCKTPNDGQRNCPKHVEFHSKNKFEKLVHLVGFIIRNVTRCTITWTSNLRSYQWTYGYDVTSSHVLELSILCYVEVFWSDITHSFCIYILFSLWKGK